MISSERYRKRTSWLDRTPESHRLTDEDIRRFVVSMKPVALQAIYSRSGLSEVAHALHYLAALRPDIIIPEIIDRLDIIYFLKSMNRRCIWFRVYRI